MAKGGVLWVRVSPRCPEKRPAPCGRCPGGTGCPLSNGWMAQVLRPCLLPHESRGVSKGALVLWPPLKTHQEPHSKLTLSFLTPVPTPAYTPNFSYFLPSRLRVLPSTQQPNPGGWASSGFHACHHLLRCQQNAKSSVLKESTHPLGDPYRCAPWDHQCDRCRCPSPFHSSVRFLGLPLFLMHAFESLFKHYCILK